MNPQYQCKKCGELFAANINFDPRTGLCEWCKEKERRAARFARLARHRQPQPPNYQHHRWYAIVGFGPCRIPTRAYSSAAAARAALERACRRDPSGWTRANSRIYAYPTRAQARAADISD